MIDCSSVHASGIHVPDRWRKEYVVSDVSDLYVSEPLFQRWIRATASACLPAAPQRDEVLLYTAKTA